jgi:hypothetical protein
MRTLIALALLALLAGCATTKPDPNYLLYREAHLAQQAAEQQRLASISNAAASCKDDTCVVAVAAVAGMAAQGGGRQAQLQQHQRQAGALERVTLGALGALPGLAQVYATIEGGRRNVDIARINAEREVAIVDSLGAVTGRVADAFAVLPPSTYVGGDLISGTQHIGDTTTVGRDQIGGDQHIGDWRTGDDTRRDTIGGDRIDTDFGNGNRIDSPGPYRDIGNEGGRCTGIGCQTTNPPPPVDPEDEG